MVVRNLSLAINIHCSLEVVLDTYRTTWKAER